MRRWRKETFKFIIYISNVFYVFSSSYFNESNLIHMWKGDISGEHLAEQEKSQISIHCF